MNASKSLARFHFGFASAERSSREEEKERKEEKGGRSREKEGEEVRSEGLKRDVERGRKSGGVGGV